MGSLSASSASSARVGSAARDPGERVGLLLQKPVQERHRTVKRVCGQHFAAQLLDGPQPRAAHAQQAPVVRAHPQRRDLERPLARRIVINVVQDGDHMLTDVHDARRRVPAPHRIAERRRHVGEFERPSFEHARNVVEMEPDEFPGRGVVTLQPCDRRRYIDFHADALCREQEPAIERKACRRRCRCRVCHERFRDHLALLESADLRQGREAAMSPCETAHPVPRLAPHPHGRLMHVKRGDDVATRRSHLDTRDAPTPALSSIPA
ncbi:hypothetical protein [Burkholderia ubonensis]|uniref:hypothetical protein n=1 Tax=Burkholderia ubonensis TaxID=101571 RepID=UPI000B30A5B9|nr:hypothetical protein [Burkholderia ubonensis]